MYTNDFFLKMSKFLLIIIEFLLLLLKKEQ